MSVKHFSYIPGNPEGYVLPLQNFLPTLPKGIFPKWVKKMGMSGNLLIDPISANPLLSVELAAAGFRILSARSNPIVWLITEVSASAPTEEDFTNVLNKLLNTRQGETTLSDHLQNLYETTCENCGNMIQPEGFVWEKSLSHPTSKVYRCPYCGEDTESKLSGYDHEKLDRLGNLGIHRSRAFQKVVFGGEYEKSSLNAALDCYLPRALYVCMLLVNRLDQLNLDKQQSKIIRAILLSIFNDAHSLKHWPSRGYRFLQLSIPQKFFERNLFLAIQQAHQQWRHIKKPVKVSYWPNLPEQIGGICFFQRDLAEKVRLVPDNVNISITTIFPRPGQAFWTLSALWAGWLWGKKAISPIRSALSRRRYDWLWFTKAVHIALKRVASTRSSNLTCMGLFPEYTPNLTFGLLTGMRTAGYILKESAYRISDTVLQGLWVQPSDNQEDPQNKIDLRKIIRDYIAVRGEPVGYPQIIMQVIFEYAKKNVLSSSLTNVTETDFAHLQNLIKQLLSDIYFVKPYSTDLPGGSRWWLINERNINSPISEKVEIEIRQILLSGRTVSTSELDTEVCSKFYGPLTPEFDLIHTVLESYAEPNEEKKGLFQLRLDETEESRQKDLAEIKALLLRIGASFNLLVTADQKICWRDPKTNHPLFKFYPTISIEISKFVFSQISGENIQQIIVFPGSRSLLLYYRLLHDPRLASAVEENWHFLKFRLLRSLGERENLDLTSWKELLDTDPPLLTPPKQLPII